MLEIHAIKLCLSIHTYMKISQGYHPLDKFNKGSLACVARFARGEGKG